jgi:hypothetical protein
MDQFHFLPKSMKERIVGTDEYYDKRKKDSQKHSIAQMNQLMQQLIGGLRYKLTEKEEFQSLILDYNRKLRNNSILSLRGRDAYESVEVAITSIQFILNALLITEDKGIINKTLFSLSNCINQVQQLLDHRNAHLFRDIEQLKEEVKQYINKLNNEENPS